MRKVCGENVIVAEGIENIDFSKIISLNESAAYLWTNLTDRTFIVDDIAKLLLDEYDVDEKTATADAKETVHKWLEAGIIEA